ncbi:hypothetical protein N7481_007672 [Penicillium waksmanii]|uniref:uncharacterized protein n=1 Tax=Penicillium waksmanii TaxID=69791 RepID=UPI00254954A5|nr:uncharacterized protein N7481_007672 [Penicillium waksmanii]KAJ5980374.1 hypothetical protein N7481_007672 [Penicillium waksmanii]
MGNTSPTPRALLVEALIFWSIGLVLYGGRMISRMIANGGIKRLFWDDYVMSATFCIYTAMLVLIQISSRYATNLMDPKDYDTVLADPKQVSDRVYGSKIVIGLEQCMLISTWGGEDMHVDTILAGYVILGFVVIMVTYYAVYCRPFQQYWAMPVDNMQCATYQKYSITQAVFNISSDAVLFAIPIPLLIKAQLKRTRKFLLIGVMSLGLFTIIAAILNKYFNFASPLTTTYQIWYIRESSTAIYVANLMCWWPLLRKLLGLKAFSYNSKNRGRPGQGADQNKDSGYSQGSRSRPSFSLPCKMNFIRPNFRKNGNHPPLPGNGDTHRSSQEAITQVSSDFMDEPNRTDSYPLDTWDRKGSRGDIENPRPPTQDSIATFENPNPKNPSPGRMRLDV